jgi:hypothetical protein
VSNLEQGRIVWAEILSPDGKKRKRRPAVVLTTTSEILPGQPFVVVAVTTQFTDPLPPDHVRLPWHPLGKVRTRLRKPTAAVCSWLAEIMEGDVRQIGGVVPPQAMLEIVRKVTGRTDS